MFNRIPIKNPARFFGGDRQACSKIYKKRQRNKNKTILKKQKVRELNLPNFETYNN